VLKISFLFLLEEVSMEAAGGLQSSGIELDASNSTSEGSRNSLEELARLLERDLANSGEEAEKLRDRVVSERMERNTRLLKAIARLEILQVSLIPSSDKVSYGDYGKVKTLSGIDCKVGKSVVVYQARQLYAAQIKKIGPAQDKLGRPYYQLELNSGVILEDVSQDQLGELTTAEQAQTEPFNYPALLSNSHLRDYQSTVLLSMQPKYLSVFAMSACCAIKPLEGPVLYLDENGDCKRGDCLCDCGDGMVEVRKAYGNSSQMLSRDSIGVIEKNTQLLNERNVYLATHKRPVVEFDLFRAKVNSDHCFLAQELVLILSEGEPIYALVLLDLGDRVLLMTDVCLKDLVPKDQVGILQATSSKRLFFSMGRPVTDSVYRRVLAISDDRKKDLKAGDILVSADKSKTLQYVEYHSPGMKEDRCFIRRALHAVPVEESFCYLGVISPDEFPINPRKVGEKVSHADCMSSLVSERHAFLSGEVVLVPQNNGKATYGLILYKLFDGQYLVSVGLPGDDFRNIEFGAGDLGRLEREGLDLEGDSFIDIQEAYEELHGIGEKVDGLDLESAVVYRPRKTYTPGARIVVFDANGVARYAEFHKDIGEGKCQIIMTKRGDVQEFAMESIAWIYRIRKEGDSQRINLVTDAYVPALFDFQRARLSPLHKFRKNELVLVSKCNSQSYDLVQSDDSKTLTLLYSGVVERHLVGKLTGAAEGVPFPVLGEVVPASQYDYFHAAESQGLKGQEIVAIFQEGKGFVYGMVFNPAKLDISAARKGKCFVCIEDSQISFEVSTREVMKIRWDLLTDLAQAESQMDRLKRFCVPGQDACPSDIFRAKSSVEMEFEPGEIVLLSLLSGKACYASVLEMGDDCVEVSTSGEGARTHIVPKSCLGKILSTTVVGDAFAQVQDRLDEKYHIASYVSPGDLERFLAPVGDIGQGSFTEGERIVFCDLDRHMVFVKFIRFVGSQVEISVDQDVFKVRAHSIAKFHLWSAPENMQAIRSAVQVLGNAVYPFDRYRSRVDAKHAFTEGERVILMDKDFSSFYAQVQTSTAAGEKVCLRISDKGESVSLPSACVGKLNSGIGVVYSEGDLEEIYSEENLFEEGCLDLLYKHAIRGEFDAIIHSIAGTEHLVLENLSRRITDMPLPEELPDVPFSRCLSDYLALVSSGELSPSLNTWVNMALPMPYKDDLLDWLLEESQPFTPELNTALVDFLTAMPVDEFGEASKAEFVEWLEGGVPLDDMEELVTEVNQRAKGMDDLKPYIIDYSLDQIFLRILAQQFSDSASSIKGFVEMLKIDHDEEEEIETFDKIKLYLSAISDYMAKNQVDPDFKREVLDEIALNCGRGNCLDGVLKKIKKEYFKLLTYGLGDFGNRLIAGNEDLKKEIAVSLSHHPEIVERTKNFYGPFASNAQSVHFLAAFHYYLGDVLGVDVDAGNEDGNHVLFAKYFMGDLKVFLQYFFEGYSRETIIGFNAGRFNASKDMYGVTNGLSDARSLIKRELAKRSEHPNLDEYIDDTMLIYDDDIMASKALSLAGIEVLLEAIPLLARIAPTEDLLGA
jgi:hypothetical protein